jgi:hypothetical protein
MTPIFALQPLPPGGPSVFLAGPTPRADKPVPSWRPAALEILGRLGFGGAVFVPEAADWGAHDNYDAQIDWEWAALDAASAIVFWIPRDLSVMPAFTTNVEFGLYATSGKVVLGFPPQSPKNRYLERLAGRADCGIAVFHDLTRTLAAGIGLAEALHAAR